MSNITSQIFSYFINVSEFSIKYILYLILRIWHAIAWPFEIIHQINCIMNEQNQNFFKKNKPSNSRQLNSIILKISLIISEIHIQFVFFHDQNILNVLFLSFENEYLTSNQEKNTIFINNRNHKVHPTLFINYLNLDIF